MNRAVTVSYNGVVSGSDDSRAGVAAAALARTGDQAEQARLAALVQAGTELALNQLAASTRRNYLADFAHFKDWCAATAARTGATIEALPADPRSVWLYLTELVADGNAAGYQPATLDRRLAAIKWMHETSGAESPTGHTAIRELMAGIRRTHSRRVERVEPLTTDMLAKVVAAIDLDTPAGLRDKALLLVGFTGALRRSELAALTREQMRRAGPGYIIELIGTKDDQQRLGRDVAIPEYPGSVLCPVAALDAWLAAAGIAGGAVFRRVRRGGKVGDTALSPAAVALIVKRCAAAAGIPPDRLSGHSLRSGHATSASLNGADDRTIMHQTGHKDPQTLNAYIRPSTVFEDNSATYLGLDSTDTPSD